MFMPGDAADYVRVLRLRNHHEIENAESTARQTTTVLV